MEINKKLTESSNIKSKDIDKKDISEILNIFSGEDMLVVKSVHQHLDEI